MNAAPATLHGRKLAAWHLLDDMQTFLEKPAPLLALSIALQIVDLIKG